jgi:hypothetical protein
VLCDNIKPAFYLFKIPRARIGFTRIRLVIAHATLVHATLNNRKTARLRERKASYNDRLVSSLRNYNIEKNVRNKIFAGKINKKN